MTAGCPDISSVGSWTSLPTSLFASIGDRLSTAPLYSLFFWLLSVRLSTVCRIVNRPPSCIIKLILFTSAYTVKHRFYYGNDIRCRFNRILIFHYYNRIIVKTDCIFCKCHFPDVWVLDVQSIL